MDQSKFIFDIDNLKVSNNEQNGSGYICRNDNNNFINYMYNTFNNNLINRADKFRLIYTNLVMNYVSYVNEVDVSKKYVTLILLLFLMEYEFYLLVYGINDDSYGYSLLANENKNNIEPNLVVYEENIRNNNLIATVNYRNNSIIVPIYTQNYNGLVTNDDRIYYRSIIKYVTSDFNILFDLFCDEMDKYLQMFTDSFVKELIIQLDLIQGIANSNDIIRLHIFDNKNMHIDNININWLNSIRIINGGIYTVQINNAISNALNTAISNHNTSNSPYIADAYGFFSRLFLFLRRNSNPGINNNYYGCCITSTLMEQYFISRLYIPSINYNLVLQSQHTLNNNITYTNLDNSNTNLHNFHLLLQTRLRQYIENKGTTDAILNNGPSPRPDALNIRSIRGYNISHWTSNLRNLNQNQNIYNYRLIPSSVRDKFITYPNMNILTDSNNYFISLVYSLIDYYWAFMDKLENITLLNNNFNSPGNRSYPKVIMHYYLNTILPVLDTGLTGANGPLPQLYTNYISNFDR